MAAAHVPDTQLPPSAMQQAREAGKGRMHRFPQSLIGIGGADKRYVVPSIVAIGPYHHGLPHLQAMEEVKKTAAYNLCGYLGKSAEAVHQKILSYVGYIRHYYNNAVVVGANLSDADLAYMMFVDGGFLLWFMSDNDDDPLSVGCMLSSFNSFQKDMFMLENQIPWLVLRAILEGEDKEKAKHLEDKVFRFVMLMAILLSPIKEEEKKKRWQMHWGCIPKRVIVQGGAGDDKKDLIDPNYNPPHLLDYLRHILTYTIVPPEKRESTYISMNDNNRARLSSLSIGAIDLVQSGIKLTAKASQLGHFAEMKCKEKRFFFGEQTLAIFKCFGQNLRMGFNYFNTMGEIDGYMCNRPVRIAIHRFVYNNYKTIAAVLSIVGALIGVLKALYSLKKP